MDVGWGYLWQNWHKPAHFLFWNYVSCVLYICIDIYFFYHPFVLEAELLAVGMNIVLGVKLHEFSTHPSHCESIFVIMEKGLAPIETSIPHSYKKNIVC